MLTLGLCQGALAQPSQPDASHAQLAWSAFKCSTLAEMSDNRAEQERLFMLGYDRGRGVLLALQAGQIDEQAVRDQAPIGFTMSASGPSVDFMLGNIFASASGFAFDDVTRETNNSLDRELRQIIAGNMYRSSNCALLR